MRSHDRHKTRSGRRLALIVVAMLISPVLPVQPVQALQTDYYEVYTLYGYEVWFTTTVGTFVGAGHGTTTDLSGWYASIEHTESISPNGRVTGGSAALYRLDGVSIRGDFIDGLVFQVEPGENCTLEAHTVSGLLSGVTRSDEPEGVGIAFFNATLVHHRAWIFGRCLTYSASAHGTITVAI